MRSMSSNSSTLLYAFGRDPQTVSSSQLRGEIDARLMPADPCREGEEISERPHCGAFLHSGGRIRNLRPSAYEIDPFGRLDYVGLGFKRNSRDRTT
jgi:hypothetical protein